MTVPNRCVGPAGLGCTVSPRYWPWLLGDQLCDSGQVTGCPVFSVKPVVGGAQWGRAVVAGGEPGLSGGLPRAASGIPSSCRQLPGNPAASISAADRPVGPLCLGFPASDSHDMNRE